MSRNVNGVVFDLDGTLLDTREVIAGALRDMLRSVGVIVSFEEMLRRAHLSPYRVIREEYNISINENEFRNRYWRFYERNIGYLSAFLGINEVLEALRNRGYRVGVATALPRTYAERGLGITNLRVEVLVAYHDTRRHRPHPEPVIRAAQELELNPNEILFIGDRTTDIIAGKRAGAFTGAAMWGLNGEERVIILREYPNYVFESTSEIIDVCGEKVFLLPCNFAIHSRRLYRNCSLLERIQSENIYSMRDRRLKSDFLGLCREDRFDLMDKCSECFKRAISEIPEYCCEICRDEMDEERYRRFGGICFRCNERMSSGDLYFEKVFTIGQERGNLAYAIKAFKGVGGASNLGLAIPLGILVANWLFEHREELEELGVDLIIPVPSSDERIREVGFDHISEVLEVVQSLVDFIEIKSGVLRKNREVRLRGLNLEERVREIRGAFTIREDARDAIHGRTILILDDVLTTGATTNECAKVLKENGARRVYVLAISRHM